MKRFINHLAINMLNTFRDFPSAKYRKDSMSELEEIYKKELEYELFGTFIGDFKTKIKECLKDLLNSAVDDSQKKISSTYPAEKVKATLEIMRSSYLSAVDKNGSKIDEWVDTIFDPSIPMQAESSSTNILKEGNMDGGISQLKTKLISLNQYLAELSKVAQLLDSEIPDFSEQKDLLEKLGETAMQRASEMQLLEDLFSKPALTNDLENSVLNMSIE